MVPVPKYPAPKYPAPKRQPHLYLPDPIFIVFFYLWFEGKQYLACRNFMFEQLDLEVILEIDKTYFCFPWMKMHRLL